MTINLDGPAAATIATRTDLPPASPLERHLRDRFPVIGLDPCLSRAAHSVATAAAANDGELPLAFTEFVIHWAGCPDPTAAVSTLLTDADGDEPLLDHVATVLADHGFTHLGVGRVEDRSYRWRWQVVLVKRSIELAPVATAAEPGQRLTLQLRVADRFATAAIYTTSPRGEVSRSEVGLSGGWAVASLELADEIGRQWVELLAEGPQGPEVLALFPVELGRQPPSIWVGAANPDESWVTTTDEAARLVVELVNRDRAAYGLPALTVDPRLSAVAREHSEDMAAAGYFAHVSPSSGDISDRLRVTGQPTTLAMENLAHSPSLTEAEEGLMRSPGHRAAILSREVTHLGVGVARSADDAMYLVTQVFTRPLVRSSPDELERDLEREIRAQRDQVGATTLLHPDLAATARYVARIEASEDLTQTAFEALVADRMALTLGGGRSWSVVAGTCHTVADVDFPASVAEARVSLVGVGAAAPMDAAPNAPTTFVILLVY